MVVRMRKVLTQNAELVRVLQCWKWYSFHRYCLDLGAWEDGVLGVKDTPYDRSYLKNKNVFAYAWDNVWEWGQGDRAYKLANADYKVFNSTSVYSIFNFPLFWLFCPSQVAVLQDQLKEVAIRWSKMPVFFFGGGWGGFQRTDGNLSCNLTENFSWGMYLKNEQVPFLSLLL